MQYIRNNYVLKFVYNDENEHINHTFLERGREKGVDREEIGGDQEKEGERDKGLGESEGP